MLRKAVSRETMLNHIEEVFDTDTATDRLSRRVLKSRWLMAPIPTVVRRETDNTMEQEKYNTAIASKNS